MNKSIANSFAQKQSGGGSAFQFVDNRPEANAQRELQRMTNNSPRRSVPLHNTADEGMSAIRGRALHNLANRSALWNVPIQGQFLLKRGDENIELPLREVLEKLNGHFSDLYAVLSVDSDEKVKTYLRKLYEGPQLVLNLLLSEDATLPQSPLHIEAIAVDDLIAALRVAIAHRLPELPEVRRPRLKGPQGEVDIMSTAWFKVNRILGNIEAKIGTIRDFRSEAAEFALFQSDLNAIIKELSTPPPDVDKNIRALKCGVEMLTSFQARVESNPRFAWRIFSTLAQFGPLGFWATKMFPDDQVLPEKSETLNHILRNIRQLLHVHPLPTVVAHRGCGPTNRTMGGLIDQRDNRRLNRPAENSPGAFAAALKEAGVDKLDGIECDVYLSQDGIPIVSHEGNVLEQISEAARTVPTVPANVTCPARHPGFPAVVIVSM